MISSISKCPKGPQRCQKKRHHPLNGLMEVWCANIEPKFFDTPGSASIVIWIKIASKPAVCIKLLTAENSGFVDSRFGDPSDEKIFNKDKNYCHTMLCRSSRSLVLFAGYFFPCSNKSFERISNFLFSFLKIKNLEKSYL